jgi:hypothetical protein
MQGIPRRGAFILSRPAPAIIEMIAIMTATATETATREIETTKQTRIGHLDIQARAVLIATIRRRAISAFALTSQQESKKPIPIAPTIGISTVIGAIRLRLDEILALQGETGLPRLPMVTGRLAMPGSLEGAEVGHGAPSLPLSVNC